MHHAASENGNKCHRLHCLLMRLFLYTAQTVETQLPSRSELHPKNEVFVEIRTEHIQHIFQDFEK